MDTIDFARRHKVGFLRTPENLSTLPTLTAIGKRFVAPSKVDTMDFCTRTEDQGSKPWCAAYSAAGFTENIMWRRNDYPSEIDPAPIYSYAKGVDGDPHGEGTTIPAVLEALTKFGYFDKSVCKIRTIRNVQSVKYALHKYGVCLGGFCISNEWYSLNKNKTSICGKKDRELIGGHCVVICGYDKNGLYIHNSWGLSWGNCGFALITWEEAERQFMYGGVLSRCCDGFDMNT